MMQLQFALSSLLIASLFAFPAMAVEDEESKKQRMSATINQKANPDNSAGNAHVGKAPTKQVDESEDFPKDHYKSIVNTSF